MATTRDFSSEQEKHIAKVTGGKVTPNSGGTKFGAGDVLTDLFLIEAKTCMSVKQSFSIKKEWIEKMKEQAFAIGKQESVLAFQFEPNGKNYYVLDERQFLDYLQWRESNGFK